MSQEQKRGCGFRRHGGTYLCGSGLTMGCDRLPIPLEVCPTCNEGLKFSRNPRQIDTFKMFGIHMVKPEGTTERIDALFSPDGKIPCVCACYVCRPPSDVPCYIMGVGERHYSPESFIKEALEMGVSKRVPAIPKNLVIGQSVVFLSHKKAILKGKDEKGNDVYQHGIFYAFKPQRIEKIFWTSEDTPELRADCEKKGITPVFLEFDKDHLSKEKDDNEGLIPVGIETKEVLLEK